MSGIDLSAPAMILDGMMRLPKAGLEHRDIIAIEETLTIENDGDADAGLGDKENKRHFYEHSEGYIAVPRWWGRKRFGKRFPIEDQRVDGASIDVSFRGRWREGQENFIEGLQYGLEVDGLGGIGKAAPAFGKTVCTAGLIARMARATLVIVPLGFLILQWAARMKTYLGTEVGTVQQDVCDYQGRAVVIAMVDSLAVRDYGADFRNYFGLVICDETHRGATTKWWNALRQFPARHRVGLTATPHRGDGAERAIHWQIGPLLVEGVSPALKCTAYRIIWRKRIPEWKFFIQGKPRRDRLLDAIVKDNDYNRWLVRKFMVPAVKAGRRVLVLSDRREHLAFLQRFFHKLVGERFKSGLFIGKGGGRTKGRGKKKKPLEKLKAMSLEEAPNVDVMFGTYPIAKEALDVPLLSVLILATPQADVEQARGRITRILEGKPRPYIIDPIYPAGWWPRRFHLKRKRLYLRLEDKVVTRRAPK